MADIRDLGRAALTVAGLVVLTSAVAPAWADSTERVSVGPGGVQGDGDSGATFGVESEVKGPAISAHGRFVVFTSFADNLVPGDTNGWEDVFVHDRQTGTTERVNLGPHGRQGNQDNTNFGLAISADGRFVAFASQADTLVPGDTNRNEDVFVRDRKLGTTERVSVGPGGHQTNLYSLSEGASISADGRFVAFDSDADNLVKGVSGVQVYVHDRVAGRTELVSAGPGGIPGNQGSGPASISADGRFVVFISEATNLVPGDTNDVSDVFVRDRKLRTTERVSVSSGSIEGNGYSGLTSVAISAAGRFVAFDSDATNLVPGDTNGAVCGLIDCGRDVFVHDRLTRKTERVSVSSGEAQANGISGYPSISGNGRFVAFSSSATNLVPGDTNRKVDIFVRDRLTGMTERVSVSSGGVQGKRGSFVPAISRDGRTLVFVSDASNLVKGDTNGARDVFVRTR